MISFENLRAGYGTCDVLQSLSASAKAGEFIALIGSNGCGKSTLLKTLCGLIKPSNGEVTIDGGALSNMPLKKRARAIAYLAQSREALPAMRVKDVIELGRAPYRGSLGKISESGHSAMQDAITRTQSESFTERRFDSLSGGEQARVLLARALAVEAPVLLADEPIAALDPFYQLSMMEILKAEAKSGRTVITALHDLPLAARFATRIWVMHEGKIVTDAAPKDALSDATLAKVFGIRAPVGGFQPVRLAVNTPPH